MTSPLEERQCGYSPRANSQVSRCGEKMTPQFHQNVLGLLGIPAASCEEGRGPR
jgi:hypothetical protein